MSLTVILIALVIYLAPTIVAFARGHQNRHALGKFNLFGGWTVFGWFTTLVWALYPEPLLLPQNRKAKRFVEDALILANRARL